MSRLTKVKPKKRGRPATGKDPLVAFRAAPGTRAAMIKWAEKQPDAPSLSEAIRRLVELGLTVRSKGRLKSEDVRHGAKQRARELAGAAIDEMTDTTASADDRGNRKRRLIRGPEEFQSVRRDRPNRK
jgi:hypothetical protein